MSEFEPQTTLCMVKPDAVQGKHVGAIITSLEEMPELTIRNYTSMHFSVPTAETFYLEHRNKEFFNDLITLMTSGMSVAMIIEGINAVSLVRELSGHPIPANARPGTFRRRFGTPYGNATHTSDSVASARREINLLVQSGYLRL